MCKVADAAMTMVNHSIDLARQTGDELFYIDFYKLHKLLYYAQGYMLTHDNKQLFEEDVEAHACGPFIPELLSLPISYSAILDKFPDEKVCPLTIDRLRAIDHTLRVYGKKTKDELVNQSKNDYIYRKFAGSFERKIIPKEEMSRSKDIFDLPD